MSKISSAKKQPKNEGLDIPFGIEEKDKPKSLSSKKEDNKFKLKNTFLSVACKICISLIIALVVCAIASTVVRFYGVDSYAIDELQKVLSQALMLDLGFIFATKIDI